MLKKIFLLLIILGSTQIHARQMRILSCDGGGIRGAATLKILKEFQNETGVRFHKDFDVYAGTSTGAIIALSLAVGIDIQQLLSDYQEMSAGVFSRGSILTFFRPEYNPNMLKNYIIQTMERAGYKANAKLGDLSKKIVIPVVVLEDQASGRWRMQIRENFTVEGQKTKVVDAILESTAAPTYFPSENGCIDGGMAMNDPSLAALMAAFTPNRSELKNFVVFAIGTGYDQDNVQGDENWGVGEWVTNLSGNNRGTLPLVEVLMDVQDQIPGQVCAALLGSFYAKYDFPLTQTFALDDYQKIPNLLQFVNDYIKGNETYWTETCNWLKTHIQ